MTVSSSCRLALPAILIAALIAPGAASAAEAVSGCSILAADLVTLPEGPPAVHLTGSAPLAAGEIIQLRMTASQGTSPVGSILLKDGGEAESPILAGAAPQTATVTVPLDGLYSFEFRADGSAPVSFAIACQARSTLALPSTSPEAFVERRAGRLLSDDTTQTSLRRRDFKPQTLDKAVQSATVLDAEGRPSQVTVSTSMQSLVAAERQRPADTKLDVWVEGRVAQFEQNFDENGTRYAADGNAGSVFFGTDYLLTPGIMVGTLLQYDQYLENYTHLDADAVSHGVLFGPYASMRLAPDIFLDARAAWGGSDNAAKLIDGTRVTFGTDRELLRSQLSAKRNVFGLEVTPNVAFSVIEDRFSDPQRLPENSIDNGDVMIGQLGVGSALSYRIPLVNGGFLKPNAALSTSWNLDRFGPIAIGNSAFANETGAKAEAGVTLGTADGVSIEAGGAIEGIGLQDYSAWSGRISLKAPLN